MNIVADLMIEALGVETSGKLGLYCKALRLACEAEPPPFGTRRYGEIFRTVASDPYWLAASLITNAEREAEGSGRLWSLAACTPEAEIAACVKQHAIDESRHARWYVKILDIAYPDAVDDAVRQHLESLSPRYSAKMVATPVEGSPFAHAVTVDDLVQMNIAEIRTAINQRLQLPMLVAHCRPSQRSLLMPLLNGLQRDEIRHVEYSARLIEQFALQLGGDSIVDLMTQRVRDFNEITCEEVELGVFPLHCSNDRCQLRTGDSGQCARKAAPN